ncbi:MAG: hypothetical protein ACT4O5_07035, partial [Gammaproteobacteria bacterium]
VEFPNTAPAQVLAKRYESLSPATNFLVIQWFSTSRLLAGSSFGDSKRTGNQSLSPACKLSDYRSIYKV